MEKVAFKYTNHFVFVSIWIILGISFSSISFIPQLSHFLEWLAEVFDITGFVISIVIVLILFLSAFIGSYVLAIIITDKMGMAILYDNYFEITFGNKKIKIDYDEIENMKFYMCRKSMRQNQKLYKYKFKLRTKNSIKLNFISSYKEMWKNYGKEHKYRKRSHSTLGELYEKIEMKMAIKMESIYG